MNKNAKKQAEKLETRKCAYDKCNNTFIVKKSCLHQKYCKENSGDQDCSKLAHREKYILERYGTLEESARIIEKDKKCENPVCTNTFDLKRGQPNQKYCSNECCSIALSATAERKGVYVYEKNKKCSYEGCTNTFDILSNAVNKKYCSEQCYREQGKIEDKEKNKSVYIKKEKINNIPQDVNNTDQKLEWLLCYVCHESFQGKNGDWCCGSECRKNAWRPKVHYDIFNRDEFRCNYCGLSPLTRAGVELTLDHVRPWTMARDDRACNIITCCSICNSEKSASLVRNEEEIYKEIAKRNFKHHIDPNTIVNASTKHRKF